MKNETIDINESIIKDFINSLRPEDPKIRAQLDFGYSYDGKVAVLYQIRPDWMEPTIILHHEFAKIKFVKTRKEWNLYWMRASGKWNLYEPYPIASHVSELIQVIKADELGCFFG